MVTKDFNGRKVLSIFENFEVDRGLAKYKKLKGTEGAYDSGNIGWAATTLIAQVGVEQLQPSFLSRLFGKFVKKTSRSIEDYNRVPVEQIFEAVMGAGKKLEIVKNRIEIHKAAISEAKALGQTALVELLEYKTATVELEAVLYGAGYKDFIEENLLIEFAEKCERGLRLDWIKNFTRIIPHPARIRKIKMDTLNVFDNYVILHYDPLNKNNTLTKKEIEKKKDPILFGVIKGSRRLYHVYSWKDELCDLTFDDLIEKFGEEVLTLK